MEQLAALRTAFNAMMEVAEPVRAEQVLRRALTHLLADDAPAGKPLDSRSPAIDAERWGELKGNVRARLDLYKQSIGDLAAETGLSRSSLEHCLSPKGSPPGRLIAERLERWLTEGAKPTPDPEPEPIVVKPAPRLLTVNGHMAPARLTIEQRERLAGYASMDEKMLRRELGMTAELVGRAVSGAELPGEAIERITVFLANAAG
jgi:hypothetical protein